MQQHVNPREARFLRNSGKPRQGHTPDSDADRRGAEAKARAAGLWNLWQAQGPRRDADATSNTRRCVKSWDEAAGSGSVQLLGSRYRQYGSAAALRHTGAAEAMADAVAQWRNPFRFPDDRAGSGFVGCDNIQCRIEPQGNEYVVNGRKWWSSGAGDPRCKIFIVMGKSDPDSADRHKQQSMILVGS